jgi:hypothetical protein
MKLSQPGFTMMAKSIIGDDPSKLKTPEEIFKTCSAISDPDPCECASKIADCLKEQGDKNNIDFSF